MKNDIYFKQLITDYPHLNEMYIKDKQLFYQDNCCSLVKLNLHDFFTQNKNLYQNLSHITSEDLFNIIKYHTIFLNFNILNISNMAETFKNSDLLIKDIRMTEKKDHNGFLKNYCYFIDEQDNPHLLLQNDSLFAINLYQKLKVQKFGSVSCRDFYNELEKNHFGLQTNENILLTIDEYQNLLYKEDDYTELELNKIKFFENYLSQLYYYQDYLLPMLKDLLNDYLSLIINLQVKKVKTPKEIEAIKVFDNILKRSTPQKDNFQSLQLQKNEHGYINGFILIAIISILGIILGLIFMSVRR